jgi:integrase
VSDQILTQAAPAADPIKYRQPPRERVAPNVYRRGEEYECGYTGTDGRWHVVTLKGAQNVTQAKRAAREILSKRDISQDVTPMRITFAEVAEERFATLEGLVASGERSARTLEAQRHRYKAGLEGALGRVTVQSITTRHIADVLSALRAKRIKRGPGDPRPLSSWTVSSTYVLLGTILQFAVTRGYRADNPVSRLSKAEKPVPRSATEPRVLTADEITKLIDHSLPTYRPLIATLAYSGLRLSEGLGLTWEDINFEADEIHVRFQLSKATKENPARRVALKTGAAKRDVVLLPQLATILCEHRKEALAKGLYRAGGFVFCSSAGTPFYGRNVAERGIGKAGDRAGLNPEGKPKLTAHDLRHSFASHLIRAGVDVYSVSRQLGHARASTTLDVYSHEFERAKNGEALRQQLATAFSRSGPA